MPEMKQLLSPKVIVPVVGIVVLVVVAALVAVFYVRNPTVTDGIFTSSDPTEAAGLDKEKDTEGEHRVEAVTAGSSPSLGHAATATTKDVDETTPLTITTTTVPQASTIHAIEPVKQQ